MLLLVMICHICSAVAIDAMHTVRVRKAADCRAPFFQNVKLCFQIVSMKLCMERLEECCCCYDLVLLFGPVVTCRVCSSNWMACDPVPSTANL